MSPGMSGYVAGWGKTAEDGRCIISVDLGYLLDHVDFVTIKNVIIGSCEAGTEEPLLTITGAGPGVVWSTSSQHQTF